VSKQTSSQLKEKQGDGSQKEHPLKTFLKNYRPSLKARMQVRRDSRGISRGKMPDIRL
jgi:hypothetical protein